MLRSLAIRAFTLVELLIVVVVLGILAGIVLPSFSSSTQDTKVSATVQNVQTIRSALDFFKVQHSDTYPGYPTGPDRGALHRSAHARFEEGRLHRGDRHRGLHLRALPQEWHSRQSVQRVRDGEDHRRRRRVPNGRRRHHRLGLQAADRRVQGQHGGADRRRSGRFRLLIDP
jgi:prepilin-type N-terminal cleavage/methylation domain-containing protein